MDSAKTILSTILLSSELLSAKGARSRRAREQHTNSLLAQKSAGLALVRLLAVTVKSHSRTRYTYWRDAP
jgi:hypothetical protein